LREAINCKTSQTYLTERALVVVVTRKRTRRPFKAL